MEINRNNYEIYFLDYLEGRLSAKECGQLKNFLSQNPDLELEMNSFESISVLPQTVLYPGKDFLKKSLQDVSRINEENFDEFCIAKLEGDLETTAQEQFEIFLKSNPNKINEYKIYLKTLLEPDKSIIYTNKFGLKRKFISRKTKPVLFIFSAAASICFIILAYNYFNSISRHESNKVADLIISIEKPIRQSINSTSHQENKVNRIAQSVQLNQVDSNRITIKNKTKMVPIKLHEQKHMELLQLKQPIMKVTPIASNIQIIDSENKENKPEINDEEANFNLNDYTLDKLNNTLKQNEPEILKVKNISLWKLAKSSVREISKLTRSHVRLEKDIDSSTNRTTYAFNSKLLGFYSSKENK
jgi:hypothetical protein